MLLTIDVGNTNTVFVVFDGEECVLESRIDTDSARMADQYAIMLADILRLYKTDMALLTGAVISSVVPPVTTQIVSAVKKLTEIDTLIIEPGLKTGLNIKLDDLASLIGADLVCGAVAAKTLYPCPCIAIDLGTVTKVLAVEKDGTLIGGVIAPGIGTSFEVMSGKTALLPLVGAEPAKRIIGSNTIDCIRSGILNGMAFMLDGFIERFEEEIGGSTVVATGGFADLITPVCKRDIIVNKRLVSDGMRFIYNSNQ